MLRRTLLLLVALAALSGCGRDNPRFIPAEQADALTARIDEAAQAAEAGECDDARAALRDAEGQVRGLSPDVAVRLRRNLREWVDALQDRLPDTCRPEKTPEPSPTPSPTEGPTEVPTVAPAPTTAPTVAPTPTPAQTPVPEITVEPEGGGAVPPEDEE